MFFFESDSIILIIILTLALFTIGFFAFIFIRDLLFLLNFFKEQQKIAVYKKNFKKYQDEKKRILDSRLQKEKEQVEEYGIDYVQEFEPEIIDFVEPVGAHSIAEFKKNLPKYERILKAAKEGRSLYWQSMIKIALSTGKGRDRGMER